MLWHGTDTHVSAQTIHQTTKAYRVAVTLINERHILQKAPITQWMDLDKLNVEVTIKTTQRQVTDGSAAIGIDTSTLAGKWVYRPKSAISITVHSNPLLIDIMLDVFDTLARKAQYFAGDVKAQSICRI